MAGSMNRATLVGNVGADPEIRDTNSGGKVATFSLATTESWKDKAGEKQERTEWHRCVIWNEGLIGVIEKYVKKGSKLLVEGQLQTRKWEKDGVERYSTEIVLSGFGGQLILLGDASGNSGNRPPPPSERPDASRAPASRPGANRTGQDGGGMDDDIPF